MHPVPVILPTTTAGQTPQLGPGQAGHPPPNPLPGPGAVPPMPTVHSSDASTESAGVLATIEAAIDRSPTPVSASKPVYHHVPRGLSPLGRAAYTGDLEQLLILIRQGCEVNVRETGEAHTYTPLVAAAENGHVAIIEALLAAGADVNLTNGEVGGTALMCAAARGHESVAALLLKQAGIRRNDTRYPGDTAFDLAAVHGHAAIAEMLFDAQSLAPGRRNELMASACSRGVLAIVELLHRLCGIDPASMDAERYLHIAASKGQANVVAYLLGAGMNPGKKDGHGMTPLQHACRDGNVAIVGKLLNHAKVPYAAATAGLTPPPLYIAADEGHLPLLDYLLNAGADPNVRDTRTGRTAAMAAAQRGRIDILRLLLACPRLQVDLACNAGCTALELARAADHRDAAIALLGAGAKVVLSSEIPYFRSFLSWAIEGRDGEMVRLILERRAAGSGQADAHCDAAVAHAVQLKCVDIVEYLVDAGLAGPATHALVGTIVPESTIMTHASAITTVFNPDMWEAATPVAGRPAGARIKLAAFFGSLETYVPMIAIGDLLLSCKPAPGPWPAAAPVQAAPLQAFDGLLPRLPAIARRAVDLREIVMLHLHGRGMLLAVALPLADCVVGGYSPAVDLLASVGQAVNAQQKAMYDAAALSTLKPQEQGEIAARIYASAGIGAKGARRLALAAQGQFDAVFSLAGQVSAMLGEQMLDQIMPACLEHTNGLYQVDVAGLVAALVESGLMRPFAQALAARWNIAVASLMAGPVTIPPGAGFAQVAHILNDGLRRLGATHFATGLLADLREASLLTALRQMTSTVPTDEALPMLFQIQADQLRQFAEQLQQS
jgi:ankyrin repeat protein